jgi:hypothetical protein
MQQSVDGYNDTVLDEQTKHGRLATADAMGSRLRRGAWQALSH